MIVTAQDTPWPGPFFDTGEERQEGIHLSDVVRLIEQDMGLAPKGKGFNDLNAAAEIGLLWEIVLERAYRDKFAIRPPQICVDGVWMSPDGINEDVIDPKLNPEGRTGLVVEEFKVAWASTNKDTTANWKYMTQVKSYCRALGTNVALMRIFHVMGDYRGSGPIYRIVRLVFSNQELDDNWGMILRYKDKLNQ